MLFFMEDEFIIQSKPIMAKVYPILYVISAIYYLSMKWGQEYMEDRKPLKVAKWLTLWNLFIASYSIFACFKCLQEIYLASQTMSFDEMVCDNNPVVPYGKFLLATFAMSKLLHFGDTVFLVMKKKPVILFHWYHHITVMLLSFKIWVTFHPLARPFTAINATVNAFLYTYLFVLSLGIKLPLMLGFVITAMELVQMLLGLFFTHKFLTLCTYETSSVYFALAIYSSYAILVVSYIARKYFHHGKAANKENKPEFKERNN